MSGTLTGTYVLSADIESTATLTLTITGTTHVVGTLVTDDDGTFDVDVTL